MSNNTERSTILEMSQNNTLKGRFTQGRCENIMGGIIENLLVPNNFLYCTINNQVKQKMQKNEK